MVNLRTLIACLIFLFPVLTQGQTPTDYEVSRKDILKEFKTCFAKCSKARNKSDFELEAILIKSMDSLYSVFHRDHVHCGFYHKEYIDLKLLKLENSIIRGSLSESHDIHDRVVEIFKRNDEHWLWRGKGYKTNPAIQGAFKKNASNCSEDNLNYTNSNGYLAQFLYFDALHQSLFEESLLPYIDLNRRLKIIIADRGNPTYNELRAVRLLVQLEIKKYRDTGDLENALIWAKENKRIETMFWHKTESNGNTYGKIRAYRLMAELYLELNDTKNALKEITSCIKIQKNDELSTVLADALEFRYLIKQKNTADPLNGIEDLMQAHSIHIKNYISNSLALSIQERTKISEQLQTRQSKLFATLTENPSQVSQEQLELAYTLCMNLKGSLLRVENKLRNQILNSEDPQITSLFEEYVDYKNRASNYNIPFQQRKEAEEEYRKIETQLASLMNFTAPLNNGWISLKQLSLNTPLIDIYFIDRLKGKSAKYVYFIISPDKRIKLITNDNGSRMNSKWYKGYQSATKYKIEDNFSYDHYLAQLFSDPTIFNASEITIIPDGIYNLINIQGIKTPSNQYVCETKSIKIANSALDLINSNTTSTITTASLYGRPSYSLGLDSVSNITVQLDQNEFSSTRAFSFDGAISDLPGTEIEVDAINAQLDSSGINSIVHKFNTATEEAIKDEHSPSILHIATHGFFLEEGTDNVLIRSGLLLSGVADSLKDSDEDGVLTALEVTNLDLGETELVVLSACETGLGEVKAGEGVYGLQRGFLIAGAQNLIMTLWKIDDEASKDFMVHFYQDWLKTNDIKKSFRSTQLAMKEKYNHPYYWASYQLIEK